ncbi:hypothetical protein SeLEV6574_g00066 [Synchytrium endobioticum]|uniref:Uncharacterized protein n=1 Tax=Synchytrium endobioticum TaxID=286115 RepID=A0A507DKZ5_9FUNG|nr:hypothetical protein SeLEV6574_g00066 [Synchytrium endobioticum]
MNLILLTASLALLSAGAHGLHRADVALADAHAYILDPACIHPSMAAYGICAPSRLHKRKLEDRIVTAFLGASAAVLFVGGIPTYLRVVAAVMSLSWSVLLALGGAAIDMVAITLEPLLGEYPLTKLFLPSTVAALAYYFFGGDREAIHSSLRSITGAVSTKASGVVGGITGSVARHYKATCGMLPSPVRYVLDQCTNFCCWAYRAGSKSNSLGKLGLGSQLAYGWAQLKTSLPLLNRIGGIGGVGGARRPIGGGGGGAPHPIGGAGVGGARRPIDGGGGGGAPHPIGGAGVGGARRPIGGGGSGVGGAPRPSVRFDLGDAGASPRNNAAPPKFASPIEPLGKSHTQIMPEELSPHHPLANNGNLGGRPGVVGLPRLNDRPALSRTGSFDYDDQAKDDWFPNRG